MESLATRIVLPENFASEQISELILASTTDRRKEITSLLLAFTRGWQYSQNKVGSTESAYQEFLDELSAGDFSLTRETINYTMTAFREGMISHSTTKKIDSEALVFLRRWQSTTHK